MALAVGDARGHMFFETVPSSPSLVPADGDPRGKAQEALEGAAKVEAAREWGVEHPGQLVGVRGGGRYNSYRQSTCMNRLKRMGGR